MKSGIVFVAIAILIGVLSFNPFESKADGVVEIDTVQKLKKIKENLSGDYILTDDIYLNGEEELTGLQLKVPLQELLMGMDTS